MSTTVEPETSPTFDPGVMFAAVAAAAGSPPADPSAGLDVVVAAERLIAWASSVQLGAISRMERVLQRQVQQERAERARALDGAGVDPYAPAGRVGPRGGVRLSSLGSEGIPSGWELAAAEIAAALRLSQRQTDTRLGLAVGLRRLPVVFGLLQAGRIDAFRAQVIVEALTGSPLQPGSEQWDAVQARVCATAPDRTAAQLRRDVARALVRVDPAAAQARHAHAVTERGVSFWAEPDGMATLSARLPAAEALSVHTCLDAMADAARDAAARAGIRDERTHDQRRADALVAVFTSILTGQPIPYTAPAATSATCGPADPVEAENATSATGDVAGATGPPGSALAWWMPPPLPLRKGRRPHLIITLAATTLNGQDEQPGDLTGYGPVSADIARRIADQAATRTTVRLPSPPERGPREAHHEGDAACHACDESRDATDARRETCDESCDASCDTQQYRPRQALIDQILAIHPICDCPGCTRPAQHCDLDHNIPYRDGGTTCRHNLRPRCRRAHRLKTHGGWTSRTAQPDEHHPPGTTIWTTRLGRHHPVPPPPRPGTPDW